MKPFIIVSMKDENKNFNYDMELPTDVPVSRLVDDIMEALAAYSHVDLRGSVTGELYSRRMGKNLPPDRTLGESGVWTGDVLIIK